MTRTGRLTTVLAFTTAAILAGVFIGCTSDGPTSPTPTTQAPPPPVAAAPAPDPAPTPGLVDPTAAPGFELACLGGSTLTVKNTGGVVAAIETFYTSFDNQDLAFGLQKHTVQSGDTVTRTFSDVCIQGDADSPGSKLIGGCFYDINGNPFTPSRNPEKVKACRDRCVEKWVEAEPEYGDWEDVIEVEDSGLTANTQEGCHKTQRRKVTITEYNSCPKQERVKSEEWEYRKVEIPCPCVYERPSHSGTGFTEEDRNAHWLFTDWWVRASANVQGAATWKLEIYAASSTTEYNNDDPDYTKATISRTLTCNESAGLFREYNSDGHSSDVWWAVLYRDGVVVWKSQAEYN